MNSKLSFFYSANSPDLCPLYMLGIKGGLWWESRDKYVKEETRTKKGLRHEHTICIIKHCCCVLRAGHTCPLLRQSDTVSLNIVSIHSIWANMFVF